MRSTQRHGILACSPRSSATIIVCLSRMAIGARLRVQRTLNRWSARPGEFNSTHAFVYQDIFCAWFIQDYTCNLYKRIMKCGEFVLQICSAQIIVANLLCIEISLFRYLFCDDKPTSLFWNYSRAIAGHIGCSSVLALVCCDSLFVGLHATTLRLKKRVENFWLSVNIYFSITY